MDEPEEVMIPALLTFTVSVFRMVASFSCRTPVPFRSLSASTDREPVEPSSKIAVSRVTPAFAMSCAWRLLVPPTDTGRMPVPVAKEIVSSARRRRVCPSDPES